jgi:hypothetical protein
VTVGCVIGGTSRHSRRHPEREAQRRVGGGTPHLHSLVILEGALALQNLRICRCSNHHETVTGSIPIELVILSEAKNPRICFNHDPRSGGDCFFACYVGSTRMRLSAASGLQTIRELHGGFASQ